VAQIYLYIDDSTAEKLGVAAKARNCSISKYVAALVSERLSEEEAEDARKKQMLHELRGAIKDPGFAEPPEIPWEADILRRFDML
jgi:hypothetical protein